MALKEEMKEVLPVGVLIQQCKTLDQAKAVLTFVVRHLLTQDALTDKSLKTTVTLTAARGRGKSAALGIAVAASIAYGYSNVFVTSPSPENIGTLMEFVLKGLDGLGTFDIYSRIPGTSRL